MVIFGSLGKRVVDFLLTFSLGVTVEELRAIIGSNFAISLQHGPVDTQFYVVGVALTNHSFSHKTKLNDLSCGIKIWTECSSVSSDGQNSHR